MNGCGTCPALPIDHARAVVLVHANCLAKGYSAARPILVERLLDLINHDYVSVIPEQGSVGASGDLIPGSYIGAVLAVLDAERVAQVADVCTAMLCEALTGIVGAFHRFIQNVKPYPGSRRSAALVRALLETSELVRGYDRTIQRLGQIGTQCYRDLPAKIQENYSLRCAVQWRPLRHAHLGAAVDQRRNQLGQRQPLYDVENRQVHSGGNFSGFHVALAMDTLKTAVASVADLLDRQFALMVDERYNNGLTPNLISRLPGDHPERGIFDSFKTMQLAISALAACQTADLRGPTSSGARASSTSAFEQSRRTSSVTVSWTRTSMRWRR